MEFRPYRLIGESDRNSVVKAMSQPLDAWALTWFRHPPAASILVKDASLVDAHDNQRWLLFGEFPDRWIAWKQCDKVREGMLLQLFGADTGLLPSVLGEAVLNECIADFAERCITAAGMNISLVPRSVESSAIPRSHGCGTEFLSLIGNGSEQVFALGGALVEALAEPSRPLPSGDDIFHPLRATIGNGIIRLEVILGEAELSLSELITLTEGDVITLDHFLSQPLTIRTLDGKPAFHAFLGRNSSQKVIQVSGT